MPMILMPAGNFIMGSDNGNADEKPVHTVFLDAFYIDKYKVTNVLYKLCVDNYVCAAPRFFNSYLRPTYYGDARYDQYPVIGVTWDMAKAYCEWRGARLLTEAEWEKAARGTDGRMYPWGNSIDQSRANYNNNGDPNYVGDTSKVDAYPSGVSPYGVFDMAGQSLGMGGGYLRCGLLRLVDFAGCESAWTDIGTVSRDTRRLMGFRCDEFAFRAPQLEWSIECKYLYWVSMREESVSIINQRYNSINQNLRRSNWDTSSSVTVTKIKPTSTDFKKLFKTRALTFGLMTALIMVLAGPR